MAKPYLYSGADDMDASTPGLVTTAVTTAGDRVAHEAGACRSLRYWSSRAAYAWALTGRLSLIRTLATIGSARGAGRTDTHLSRAPVAGSNGDTSRNAPVRQCRVSSSRESEAP